jgi:predicted transcriptional regulator
MTTIDVYLGHIARDCRTPDLRARGWVIQQALADWRIEQLWRDRIRANAARRRLARVAAGKVVP